MMNQKLKKQQCEKNNVYK